PHPAGRPNLETCVAGERERLKLFENFVFRAESDAEPLELTSSVQRESGQRSDFQFGRDLKVLLDVHFEHEERSTHLLSQPFELPSQRSAAAAAGLPKLDQHGYLGASHDPVEIPVHDVRNHDVASLSLLTAADANTLSYSKRARRR